MTEIRLYQQARIWLRQVLRRRILPPCDLTLSGEMWLVTNLVMRKSGPATTGGTLSTSPPEPVEKPPKVIARSEATRQSPSDEIAARSLS